jgi:WD40 repeat protein/predicted Ser/Thr protein kinase
MDDNRNERVGPPLPQTSPYQPANTSGKAAPTPPPAKISRAPRGPLQKGDWISIEGKKTYKILEKLGQGGMGVVYQARQVPIEQLVALKMIRCDDPAEADGARFLKEAQALARLEHQNIVRIYYWGEHAGQPYFTMTFACGGSLARCMARFRDDPARSVTLVEKLARALQFAHEHGIIHRDLKPGNVLLDAKDEPLLSDFGLAKDLAADVLLTQPGQVPGTPAYMAPEQAAGQTNKIKEQTDVWGLGVLLFELLTGRLPFLGKGREELTRQILHDSPPDPCDLRRDLDRGLGRIVLRCLEKDPKKRYASAAALAEALRAFQDRTLPSPKPIWKRKSVWAAAMVLALAAGLLASLFWNKHPAPGAPGTTGGPTGPGPVAVQKPEVHLSPQQRFAGWKLHGTLKLAKGGNGPVPPHSLGLTSLAFSPDGKTLAALSFHGEGTLWDVASGEERPLLYRQRGMRLGLGKIENLWFSPDSKNLVTSGFATPLTLWDAARGTEREPLETLHGGSQVKTLAFAPNGELFASCSSSRIPVPGEKYAVEKVGDVKVWATASGERRTTCKGIKGSVLCLAFSPRGDLLAGGGGEEGDAFNDNPGKGEVKLWDSTTGKVKKSFPLDRPVQALAFHPDGGQLVIGYLKGLRERMVRTPVEVVDLRTEKTHVLLEDFPVSSLAFSPNGALLLLGGSAGARVAAVDKDQIQVASGRTLNTGASSVRFLADGETVVSGGAAGLGFAGSSLKLWDATTGNELPALPGHTGAAVAADGKMAATWNDGEAIQLWTAVSARE